MGKVKISSGGYAVGIVHQCKAPTNTAPGHFIFPVLGDHQLPATWDDFASASTR
jgi:hypothetical protein